MAGLLGGNVFAIRVLCVGQRLLLSPLKTSGYSHKITMVSGLLAIASREQLGLIIKEHSLSG